MAKRGGRDFFGMQVIANDKINKNPENNNRTPKVLTLEEQLKQLEKDKIENRKKKEKDKLKQEEKYEEIRYVPTSSGFYRA